jgi:hypothetical protein
MKTRAATLHKQVVRMTSRKNEKTQGKREESSASVRTATYNRVNPVLWDDEKFLELDDLSGKLWLMLLTGPLVTALPGLQRGGLYSLCDVLRRPIEQVEASVQALRDLGMIEIDARRRVIWIPNAPKHNPAESPNHLKAWWNRWNEIPDCPLKFQHVEHLKKHARLDKASHRKVWDQTFGAIELIRSASREAIERATTEALRKVSAEALAKAMAPGAHPLSEGGSAHASTEFTPPRPPTEASLETAAGATGATHEPAPDAASAAPAENPATEPEMGPLFSVAATVAASSSEGLPQAVSHSASATASVNTSATASAAAAASGLGAPKASGDPPAQAPEPSRAEPRQEVSPIVAKPLAAAALQITEPARCPTIERPYEIHGGDACMRLRALSQGRLKTTATPQQAVLFGEMVAAMAQQHQRADLVELLGAFALAGGFDWMTQRKPTLGWFLEGTGGNLTDSIEQALTWEADGRGPVKRGTKTSRLASSLSPCATAEAFEADVAERERTGPINYAEYTRKRAAALEVRE